MPTSTASEFREDLAPNHKMVEGAVSVWFRNCLQIQEEGSGLSCVVPS